MTKDYMKRLSAVKLTSWDLNCRDVIPHTPSRNKLEKKIRRNARRLAKQLLKKEIENEV